jgi:hypothetical protein
LLDLRNGAKLSSSSIVAHPQFADPLTRNFRLKAISPAIDAGMQDQVTANYPTDLGSVNVPQQTYLDIGGYEYKAN